jgi:drug/metabolite transporter (DMT)-like permease
LVLDERITLLAIIGTVMILAGVALSQRKEIGKKGKIN